MNEFKAQINKQKEGASSTLLQVKNQIHRNKCVTEQPQPTYLLAVNNENTRTMCETCLKLARSDIFIDDLEHVSYIVLMFPLLTLQKKKNAYEGYY